jgi:hypothetical protein
MKIPTNERRKSASISLIVSSEVVAQISTRTALAKDASPDQCGIGAYYVTDYFGEQDSLGVHLLNIG